MQHTLTPPPIHRAEFDQNPVFNVVIAYEDFETGKHAKETYDYLAEHLGRDCEFTNQMWKFDVLNIPKLRQLAAADASAADIVVISGHGDDLPEHVKLWIESWLQQEPKPLALVALFDRPAEEVARTQTARNYLAQTAERAGMEFFAQPDEWPGRAMMPQPEVHVEVGAEFDQRTLSTLAGVVKRDAMPVRWGLGE